MDKLIAWLMVATAVICLWAVVTPNHLFVG